MATVSRISTINSPRTPASPPIPTVMALAITPMHSQPMGGKPRYRRRSGWYNADADDDGDGIDDEYDPQPLVVTDVEPLLLTSARHLAVASDDGTFTFPTGSESWVGGLTHTAIHPLRRTWWPDSTTASVPGADRLCSLGLNGCHIRKLILIQHRSGRFVVMWQRYTIDVFPQGSKRRDRRSSISTPSRGRDYR